VQIPDIFGGRITLVSMANGGSWINCFYIKEQWKIGSSYLDIGSYNSSVYALLLLWVFP
jgi:hypothetical protein